MPAKKPAPARRVSLRLPPDLAAQVEAIAHTRRKPLDDVVAGFLRAAVGGAPFIPGAGREHVAALERAFDGLSEEEMLAVDGIFMTGVRQPE